MAEKYKPREFEIRDAERRSTLLKVGLFSPSGGGKTYTALRLATGIQEIVGGDIVLVDTENGRSLQYADFFKFRHIDFRPPFSSLAYLDAMRAASKAGSIVIVDSMSHEHEGPGGMLEFHEAETDRLAGAGADWRRREAVKMLAWQKPKENRRTLLNSGVLGVQSHLILCFRAKNTAKPVRVAQENGATKTEVHQLGFMPIAGDEFVWEMDLAALFMPGAEGVPTWKSENSGEMMMVKVPRPLASVRETYKAKAIDEELGRNLARWAVGGAGGKEDPAPAAGDSGRQTADTRSSRQTSPGSPRPEVADKAAPPQGAGATGDLLGDADQAEEGRKAAPEATGKAADSAADKIAAGLDQAAGKGQDDAAPAGPPETWIEYAEAVALAETWPAVASLIEGFARTEAYKTSDQAMKAKGRVVAWRRLQDLNGMAKARKAKALDFMDDAQAFRCYLEVETDGDALLGNRRAFEGSDLFRSLSGPAQAAFTRAADARATFIAQSKAEDRFQ